MGMCTDCTSSSTSFWTPIALLGRGSESRERGFLVSIPSLYLILTSADPEIHPRSVDLDRPRLGDLLCTSLLGLRQTLVLEIDKISCFMSWMAPSERYLDRPWTFRSSYLGLTRK